MIIKDIEYKLKDGRNALIRSPQDEDIQGMLEYLYISAGETDFILRYPEECNKYTVEGEKALFDRVNKSKIELNVGPKMLKNDESCYWFFQKKNHGQIGIMVLHLDII